MFKKNQKFNLDNNYGQSILEVIIAMAVFSLIGAAMVTMAVGGFITLEQGGEQTEAEALAQEAIEAVRAIHDRAWNEIIYNPALISNSTGQWVIGGGESELINNKYTRTITFEDVCRDSSDDITACPEDYTDVHSQKVTVVVEWTIREGIINSVQKITYLTNWDSQDWTQTDWSGGKKQTTWLDVTKYNSDNNNIDDRIVREVKLGPTINSTWTAAGGESEIDTTDTDFDDGDFSNATTTGSGVDANIILDQGQQWAEHADSQSATSEELRGLDVVSTNDAWAVGKNGEIIYYNGTSWSATSSPTAEDLEKISMASASHGFAVGKRGEIIQHNGASWVATSSPTNKDLKDIALLSITNGFAVGKNGIIIQYDGASWLATSSPTNQELKGIFLFSSTKGFAVGKNGTILEYDGASWSTTASPTVEELRGVSLASSVRGFAVGKNGTILEYDGGSWSATSSPTGEDMNSIYMVSATDGWAVGKNGTILQYDGASWSVTSSPTVKELKAVAMISLTAGLMVGKNGVIVEYINTYDPVGTFLSEIVNGGAGADWNSVYWTETLTVGSDITIATRSGNTATPDGAWSGWSGELTDETGSTITSGDAQYLQYRVALTRGVISTETPSLADITIIYNAVITEDLEDLSMVAVDNIWAVGKRGMIAHYNGSAWSSVSSPTAEDLKAVDMVSASKGFAVGKNGTILEYNGSSWSEHADSGSATAKELKDIHMLSSSLGFAVGKKDVNDDTILSYNGINWNLETSTVGEDLNGIFAVASNNVWAVGKNGVIIYYDGANWTEDVNSGSATGEELKGIYMISASDGWAVAKRGVIIRYSGGSWSSFTDTGDMDWESVFMSSANDGFVVGKTGNIYLWDGASWATIASSPTSSDLKGVEMISKFQGWAVGKGGAIIRILITSGALTSSDYNASGSQAIQVIEWDDTLPSCSPACEIRFQIKTAATQVDLASAEWSGFEGKDGDETDYFTTSAGTLVHTDHNSDEWIRYKVIFTGDGMDTPVLTEVKINYK